jgi:hypothetical protein
MSALAVVWILTCGPSPNHHPHGCGIFPTLQECQRAGHREKDLGYWECVKEARQYGMFIVPKLSGWDCRPYPTKCEPGTPNPEISSGKPYLSLFWCKHDGEQALRAGQIISYRCTSE